jgi:hypothetical protein
MELAKKRNWIRMICHIPIPDENNSANPAHNLRTCVKEWQEKNGDTISTKVPNLSTDFPSEWSEMQSGAIYEYELILYFSSADLTNLQRRNEMDTKYSSLVTEKIAEFRSKLKFWGFNRDVP